MSTCKVCTTTCNEDSLFCHKCGTRIEKDPIPTVSKIPNTLTVKEAAQIFFQGRVSAGAIYAAIRQHRLPHVKLSSGKILLDSDELTSWWKAELEKSKSGVEVNLKKAI